MASKAALKQILPVLTLGNLIAQIEKVNAEIAEISAKDKDARARKQAIEADLMALMDSQQTRVSEYKGKRISITESEEPNVTDWDAFLAGAVKGKYLHLVQRRISAPAWRELRALKGKDVAGTEVFVKRSLSVRSVTAK